VNYFLQLPIEARLAILFVVGVFVAGQLNRCIYRWAYFQRAIGPWSPPHPDAPPRRWFDRLPIVGWVSLRRESSIHGNGFWVRPMVIELLTGVGFAWQYWWELAGRLTPPAPPQPFFGPGLPVIPPGDAQLQAAVLSHLVLIALMIVATFIDMDEKTIPDNVTLPGTVLGLAIATFAPFSLLPVLQPQANAYYVGFLKLTSPQMTAVPNWPLWLNGGGGLLVGLLCFAAWCYAIWPKTWWTRSGPIKTIRYLVASMIRHDLTVRFLLLWLLGSLAIVGIWWATAQQANLHWQGCLSALVGMAFGGGLIWAVRTMGTFALQKEAMGFGDVTLMAMIGAFVGWQSTLIIFFLAPFAGVVIAVTQWILTREGEIYFGPFLCLSTLFTIIFWARIWDRWGWPVFQMGWLVPALVLVCLVLMGGMLGMWRFVSERLFRS